MNIRVDRADFASKLKLALSIIKASMIELERRIKTSFSQEWRP